MKAGSTDEDPRPQFMLPCVIGDRYPELCNKAYPTIEKHNAHIRRSHSAEYWCDVCSHKFNSSLPSIPLRLAKKEHEKSACPGKSSEESSKCRSKHFLMSQEQSERFKLWKNALIPAVCFGDSSPETPPQTSWRRIREAIFPGTGGDVLKEGLFRAPTASNNRSVGDVGVKTQQAPSRTDEGYVSMTWNREWQSPGISEKGFLDTSARELEQDMSDLLPDPNTLLWLCGSGSLPAYHDWDAELADKLYNDLCLIELEPDHMRRLKSALLPSFDSFAARLGSGGFSETESEIMSFFHERRFIIVTAFNKLIEEANDRKTFPRLLEKSFQDTRFSTDLHILPNNMTQMLSHDSSLPMAEPMPSITIQDIPIQDEGPALPDDAILKWRAGMKSESMPRAAQPDLNHAKRRSSLIDQERFQDLVLNSVAYKWLVACLSQKLMVEVVDVDLDVPGLIRQEVFECFENPGHTSRWELSRQYQMTFAADWNPVEFFNRQFGSHCDANRLLGEVLTLTGTTSDAQILPCSEYLSQTWPTTGLSFLELLRKALVSEEAVSGELEDKTSVRCQFTKSGLIVQVNGITDSIAIIGEQIGWLGAALRSSSSHSGFSMCQPIFKISKMDIDVAKCSFEFPTIPLDLTGDMPGQCWHAIFRNPVIVEGYPIPRRKRYGSGLEMPLNVMAGLNSSPRIHKYEGNYYLKGYSTALVPTEKIDNMVLWHLYYSDDGSRLPYPNPTGLHYTDLSMQDLTAARHVVGWCSNAKFMTVAADMNYDIGASQLQRPGKEFALEKISFSFGQFVTGGCQFAIGRKDRHVRATKGTYIDKLKWLDKKYVTLWDVDDERGWLVNGNAALLHLLRSSLQHSSTDKFSSDFHFQPQNFQESKNPHSLDSALEVLRNSKNQQLELYDKDTDIQQGSVATSRTTVKDRVEELYEVLEKLFDYTVTSEASAKGLNAKSRFQDHLEGWDFADIATNRDPFFIKRTTLGFSMLGWPDLVRANYAITLFGKGFGDLIEAVGAQQGGVCQEWRTVPKNKNLLCVSTSHLIDIIADAGGSLATSPITVMPGLFWKAPASTTTFDIACQCDIGGLLSRKHHAVQSLISSKLWTGRSQACVKLDDHSNGAVIFGPLIDRKRPWGSSASISRSGSQSSNLSTLGGSTTSSQTVSQDLASSSSSVPASSPAETQEQTISETSVVDREASPPSSGSTTGDLGLTGEGLGTREFRRFRNWFPSKKAKRH